jgi:hypothetical protein
MSAAFSIRFSRYIRLPLQEDLVGSSRLELPTSRLSGARSNHLSYEPIVSFGFSSLLTHSGGDEQARTVDPLLAKQVLFHLSYTPVSGRSLSAPRMLPLAAALHPLN